MFITVEQLLEIVQQSQITITLPDTSDLPEWMSRGGDTFEVIDARAFGAALIKLVS